MDEEKIKKSRRELQGVTSDRTIYGNRQKLIESISGYFWKMKINEND